MLLEYMYNLAVNTALLKKNLQINKYIWWNVEKMENTMSAKEERAPKNLH
jgi:hypothetical protein